MFNVIWKKLWSKKYRVYTIIALLCLIFLGWQIVRRAIASRAGLEGNLRGAAVAVEIAAIERGAIRDVGTFSGTLIPKSYFTVVPKISGRLKELHVDIGDALTRGQLVAVLEDEEYQQQAIQAEAGLGVAKANLEEAKSTLELASRDLERARTLHGKGILADSELEAAASRFGTQEARYKVAAAQVDNEQAALETARGPVVLHADPGRLGKRPGRPLRRGKVRQRRGDALVRTRLSSPSSSSSRSRRSSTSPKRTISGSGPSSPSS